ncbi:MAG TPA: hypothetical protein VHZ74_08585 [Bryobacteraceae bacterium]|nr:hypothetical protein [Bryobacteraceae bacterium]
MPPPDEGIRPSEKFRSALEQLGGVYLAFGQFLRWRADLLGVDYLNALRQIQPVIAPVAQQAVAALVRVELGPPGDEIARRMEAEPVWSTLFRTAYLSWHKETIVVVQVAREPIVDSVLAEFEVGIQFLGHPDLARVTTPGILAEFRQWIRGAESTVRERSYLAVLGRNQGQTLVDYPVLIEEITTDRILCWPWVEGEPVSSLIRRGSVEAITQVAVAVLEQFFTLAMVDADLDADALVLPTGGMRLAVRRFNRPLSVPPPSVNVGMKYVAAVLEGNASVTVQTLLTLAAGESTAALDARLLNLMSGIEPELKIRLWYPGSAAAFESNWRALEKLGLSRARPLYLDCLHRNLIAIGYWTADAISAGGAAHDTITAAHSPVVSRELKASASQFLDPAVLKEWSVGLTLLTFGTMRQANRLAEEVREHNITLAADTRPSLLDLQAADSRRGGRRLRMSFVAGLLLVALLVALLWGSRAAEPAASFLLATALACLAGLIWTVRRIG